MGVFRYAWRGSFPRPDEAGALTRLGEAATLSELKSLADKVRQFRDYLYLDYYLPQHLGGFVVNPRKSKGGR